MSTVSYWLAEPMEPLPASPARLQLAFLDPEIARELRIVATYLLDESLGILAADERLDGIAERERWRERVVQYGVDDHG